MDDTDSETWSGYATAPRWAKIGSFIRQGCIDHGLDLLSIDFEKGWIRETVYWKIKGTEQSISWFKTYVWNAINAYNKTGN